MLLTLVQNTRERLYSCSSRNQSQCLRCASESSETSMERVKKSRRWYISRNLVLPCNKMCPTISKTNQTSSAVHHSLLSISLSSTRIKVPSINHMGSNSKTQEALLKTRQCTSRSRRSEPKRRKSGCRWSRGAPRAKRELYNDLFYRLLLLKFINLAHKLCLRAPYFFSHMQHSGWHLLHKALFWLSHPY